jgi:hypothetical protein
MGARLTGHGYLFLWFCQNVSDPLIFCAELSNDLVGGSNFNQVLDLYGKRLRLAMKVVDVGVSHLNKTLTLSRPPFTGKLQWPVTHIKGNDIAAQLTSHF